MTHYANWVKPHLRQRLQEEEKSKIRLSFSPPQHEIDAANRQREEKNQNNVRHFAFSSAKEKRENYYRWFLKIVNSKD